MKIKKIVVVILLTILYGCGKPEKHELITHYLDQSVKDYTIFPVNSYWVYYDSISNIQDSINTINIEQHFFRRAEDFNQYERLELLCYSSKDNNNFSRLAYVMEGSNNSVYLENDTVKFNSDLTLGENNEGIIYSALLDTIQVRGNYYYHVKVFSVPNYNLHYYFAEHVGLIKEKINTSVKELDHYYVNN